MTTTRARSARAAAAAKGRKAAATSSKSARAGSDRAPQKKAKKGRTKAAPRVSAPKTSTSRPARAAAAPPSPRRASPEERVEALTRVFAALGARKPELWARTHVETGSDEIGRFVFLRALWMRVVEPGRALAQVTWDPTAASAFERVVKAGVSLADLDALVRFAQRMALEDVCRVIDDPVDRDEGIRWGLFRLAGDGSPLWELPDLAAGLGPSEP